MCNHLEVATVMLKQHLEQGSWKSSSEKVCDSLAVHEPSSSDIRTLEGYIEGSKLNDLLMLISVSAY